MYLGTSKHMLWIQSMLRLPLHLTHGDNFNILGREDQGLTMLIKESIYIRVNNPTLNRNIGKFNFSHIWDRVLLNTPGLELNNNKGQMQAHNNSPLQPIPPWVKCRDSLSMCLDVPRYIKVAVMLALFLDQMKITVVIESLSITKPNVLQREYSTVLMYYQQNEKSTEINLSYCWCIKWCIYILTSGTYRCRLERCAKRQTLNGQCWHWHQW